MKNVVLLMSLLLSFLMVGCSQDVGLTVNISWDDNDDFTSEKTIDIDGKNDESFIFGKCICLRR